MELSFYESRLIKRLRQDFRDAEITIIMQDGRPVRIKHALVYHKLPANMTKDRLWEFIQKVAPFGEVMIYNRKGFPTRLEVALTYAEISSGF